ncbi:MAG TPA: hypothetical protein VL981_05770 [Candidatus Methylacidiphilales bacterium]|nr:hypothetical protein [Candidatus Methylacidiphilales bacterium]
MNRFAKIFLTILLGGMVFGLTACAGTNSSDMPPPSEAPSQDDLSHGWGPSPSQ